MAAVVGQADAACSESYAACSRWRTSIRAKPSRLKPLPGLARRLKEMEGENTWLKRIVADKELEIDALRAIAKGIGEPVAAPPGRGHAAGTAWYLAAAGVPDHRPAPFHPALPARAGS